MEWKFPLSSDCLKQSFDFRSFSELESLFKVNIYFFDLFSLSLLESGGHLFSHTVSNAVPSAAYVLTVVFGMGTGVSHKRIATRNFEYLARFFRA